MSLPYGEIAALGTAFCWSASSILFTYVAKKIGAVAINRMRLTFALVFLLVSHKLVSGSFIPQGVSMEGWMWLGASGIAGLLVGDSFLYKGYKTIGPRKTILVSSTTPLFSSLMAFFILGETLSFLQLTGITLTVAGVSWVVAGRSEIGNSTCSRAELTRGVLYSTAAAICQSGGLILVRQGQQEVQDVLSFTLIRMLVVVVLLWGFSAARRNVGHHIRQILDRRIFIRLAAGSVIGPFTGIFLSMVAITHAPLGVVSAMIATQPIMMIPLASFFLKDRSSATGFMGTIIAVGGTIILLLN